MRNGTKKSTKTTVIAIITITIVRERVYSWKKWSRIMFHHVSYIRFLFLLLLSTSYPSYYFLLLLHTFYGHYCYLSETDEYINICMWYKLNNHIWFHTVPVYQFLPALSLYPSDNFEYIFHQSKEMFCYFVDKDMRNKWFLAIHLSPKNTNTLTMFK